MSRKISKFLSLVLRHAPEKIGLILDEAGWVGTGELLGALEKEGMGITMGELKTIVKENDKKRFEFGDSYTKIRASQGHSIKVNLGYEPTTPPRILFHGTSEGTLDVILDGGIKQMTRDHVHLSADYMTAVKVGQRKGRAIVIMVDAERMVEDGHVFYKSTNGVWLTNYVPPQYLEIEEK
jgi:putative RNA 2'-phosphotransferase